MSRLKTDAIRNTSASADALTFDTNGHVTAPGNATITGQLKTAGIRNASASSDAITFATDGTCTAKITNNLSNRNLIINGDMRIAQRGTSKAMTSAVAGGYYFIDRWISSISHTDLGAFTLSQDASGPSGFKNSLKVQCTTASTSLSGSSQSVLTYRVEAQDIAHIFTGNADAQQCTLSFWYKSNSTDQRVLWFYNPDASRHYSALFQAAQANTWERITVVIPADTSGAVNNDNGVGLYVRFVLSAGSTYTSGRPTAWEAVNNTRYQGTADFASSTNNNIYITGVQLEVGEVATDYEHRSYGDEFARCQRYYHNTAASVGGAGQSYSANSTDGVRWYFAWPTKMRTTPTTTCTGGSDGGSSASLVINAASTNGCVMNLKSTDSNTSVWWTGATVTADAEL